MTWFLDTALVSAAVGLVSGAFVPQVIARIPEPAPEPTPEPVPGDLVAADNEAQFARPVDDPKELYAEVAALPGLRVKTALAGALAAAAIGGHLGWHPVLALLLFLVPVGLALSVVDWHTRYLPTALIGPAYVVVVVLAVLASVLTGDWRALEVAGIGWLATFVVFFVMWFIHPRGLGYGDVRLSGLLAIALGWLGVGPLVLGIYTGFLLGGLGGLLLNAVKVFHRKHYPFGPFMVLGAWLAVVFPGQLAAAYGWVINGIVSLVS